MQVFEQAIERAVPRKFRKHLAAGLSLVLLCPGAGAIEPPAGTATALDNVGHFDGSQNLLNSCVALQNADGSAQVDANGKALTYDVVLGLNQANLTFRLLSAVPFDTSAGKDCSGVYRNGVYTDAVLITNLAPAYDASVWKLTLDYVANTNLEFQLRLDSSFSAIRNFTGNTTQLGADLGDFAQSAVREHVPGSAATFQVKLPQCSDPQGDTTLVTLVRNGAAFGQGLPGSTFAVSTSGLGAGDYRLEAYCSDEAAIRAQAAQAGVAYLPGYAATSARAAGVLTLRVVAGGTGPAGQIAFNFAASTSTADQELIRDTAMFAQEFLQATFGRTLQKNTTITTLGQSGGCANPGASAFAGGQSLTFCTSNMGWNVHGPVTKRKILIHEMFHLLQFELRWLGGPPGSATGPHWLIEGAAEYVGWLGIAARGDLPLATAHGCMLKEVADFAPGLPNLSGLETAQNFGPGPVYPLSMIGTHQLVAGASVSTLLSFGTALANGTAWTAAFSEAFGTTPAAFYAQFPAYRTGLAVPSSYACRI